MAIIVYFDKDAEAAKEQSFFMRAGAKDGYLRRAEAFDPQSPEMAEAVIVMPDISEELAKPIILKYQSKEPPVPCFQPSKGEVLRISQDSGKIDAQAVVVSVKPAKESKGGIPVANVQGAPDVSPDDMPDGEVDADETDGGNVNFPPVELASSEQMRSALRAKGFTVPPRLTDENLRIQYSAMLKQVNGETDG